MIFERNIILNMWIILVCIVFLASFLFKVEFGIGASLYFLIAIGIIFTSLSYNLKTDFSVLDSPHKIKVNFVLVAFIIGAFSCIPLLIENKNNFSRDWSEIREYHLESRSGSGFFYTLNFFLSPLIFIPYVILNFQLNRVLILFANIVALLVSFSFIFITGGRVHFIVFGLLYISVYLLKNRTRIRKKMVSYLLRFILAFIGVIILGSSLTLLRNTADTSRLLEVYLSLNNLKIESASSLLKYEWGTIVFVMLTQAFEYVGQCLLFFSMYFDYYDTVPTCYGFFEFNYLDRFGVINWLEVHDSIDYLYSSKFGINHNVWGTLFRDIIVDFGVVGSLLFLFLLLLLFRASLRNLSSYLSAQVLYILLFSIFIFSPFYSLISIRGFSLSFVCVVIWFTYNTSFTKGSNRLRT